ncbi:hypothetical protein P5673_028349 [Acropora cervicornis]|uniref:Uncharacterized protein n=1 Tax=Acropora cervicornis TaxID=6130 RepID=A0AAD9UV72_ACRCE|nr:hypothetical protein P5673_028349 [Acropora cervicornis]
MANNDDGKCRSCQKILGQLGAKRVWLRRLDKTKIYMQDRKKQTDAAYSSSSFARAASSSSLFSNLNQRSSATRGKREGNAVENVAMLNSLNFLFGFDDTVQHT